MSRKHAGVYWTHNDGDDGVLYAIHSDGGTIAKFKIDGVDFRDWEDIANDGDGNLYLADIGNNQRERKHMTIYRVAEPDPSRQPPLPGTLKVDATWKVGFPDRPFNCESLFIHEGYGYVISKLDGGEHRGERAGVYRFPLSAGKKHNVLERVCELPIVEPVTAADLSADGKTLAILSQHALSLFQIDGDVRKAADAAPRAFPIPPIQAEGCAFNPQGVLLIAESGEIVQVTFDRAPAVATQSTPSTRPALPAR